ncbi:hypothetical protein ACN42_g5444 [Penicillium freii]|uniref:Uncharacterized protein n=1 Tax=Penicillium freii TaxID=48697 RepID=A0A101MJE7_PENFR|nr:hypothetical protein ACN42_g5444 [Penicillium freii]
MQVLRPFSNSQEVIGSQRSHLACESNSSIAEEEFGLRDTPGVQQNLTRRGVCRMVFEGDVEIGLPQRNPRPLTAPSHMNQLWRYGRRDRNSLTVLGAADSSFARNWYGLAVIRMVESVIFDVKVDCEETLGLCCHSPAFKGGDSGCFPRSTI